MAPIRVGLSGLAASKPSSLKPGAWGVMTHLAALQASPHYEIVAICNSSIESSRKSIEYHNLGDHVKAYGNPEDMANDQNIDLVVCSVNVGKHHLLTMPALLKEKMVFVEWPLAATLEQAHEMADLAKTNNIRTMVGTQFRGDPLLARVRQIITSGEIGSVLSSVAWGCPSLFPLDSWMDDATYYLDMESGGNEFFIYFGHFLDAFIFVLGDFDERTIQSTLKTHFANITIKNSNTGEVVDEAYPKTSPDHTFVQGILKSGAIASVAFRRARGTTDQNGLRWIITGSEGEIEITIPEGQIQSGSPGRELRLRKANNAVQTVDFTLNEPQHIGDIPFPATNVARIYENFAMGKKEGYGNFEDALCSQELLVKIAKKAGFL